MISAVHHIALIISSEENLRFYNRLGFRERFRKIRQYDTVVLLYGYGMELEVFIDSRHPQKSIGLDEPYGIRHFALQISPDSNLEEEIERLKDDMSEGLEFGTIMTDWEGVRYVFVKDPDGTVVEIREKNMSLFSESVRETK